MNTSSVLQVHDLRKTYGGIVALNNVDFELRHGEIHGLCGENGAGKSTLVKILGGLVEPDSGQIKVAGEYLHLGKRIDPRLISIVHQELSIIPDLSVIDNILIGDPRVRGIYLRSRFEKEVRQQLDKLELSHIDLHCPARQLSLAEQQLVEIARGVARGAKVLLLDEPTATLADSEIARVFQAVRWLRDQGTTVVFISHRLAEVFELTDRITVFRNGQRILTAKTCELSTDQLVSSMIGHALQRRTRAPVLDAPSRQLRLQLTNFTVPPLAQPLNLQLAAGEIIGVVGQLGSGADHLIEALAGLRNYSGTVHLDSKPICARSPSQAIAAGVAYVPEDRAGKGVFLETSVATNVTSTILEKFTTGGFLSTQAESQAALELASQFTIDPKRLPSHVSQLSGGNQQKVAMAKAAALKPRLLLLNEPTRGVDIGARSEIYEQLRAMAHEGLSVLFFSTDFEEVLELADRVITIFRGKVVNDLSVEHTSLDSILQDIIHGSHGEGAVA